MLLVFDHLWPVLTTTVMRRGMASLLRFGANLFATRNTPHEGPVRRQELLHHADVLRDRLGATIANLRSSNGPVFYDFGADREEHVRSGDMIIRAAVTSAAMFL